jgi:hypothetical protein
VSRPITSGVWALVAPWLFACGSVQSKVEPDAPDLDAAAPADAWQPSCAPEPLITRVESASAYYGDSCVHGSWNIQARNGTTVPATPIPDAFVPVVPVSITIGSNPLDPTSTFAVHVSGSGQGTVDQGSYAALIARLNVVSPTEIGTVDASQYTGLQFYAIVDSSAGAWVRIANLYTEPLGQRCTDTPGPTQCYDHPNAELANASTWTKYQIPFASLRQFGGGYPSPVGDAFPRDALIFIQWLIGVPATGTTPPWELWIDDLTFY